MTCQQTLMTPASDLMSLAAKISSVCGATKSKVIYFAVASLFASLYLTWLAYSAGSALWWNVLKGVLLLLPALVWLLFWFILRQLQALPEHLQSLSFQRDAQQQGLFADLQDTAQQSGGIRRVIKLLWQLKTHEGIDSLVEAAGSLGILISPLFIVLLLISGSILLLFLLLAMVLIVF